MGSAERAEPARVPAPRPALRDPGARPHRLRPAAAGPGAALTDRTAPLRRSSGYA